MMMKKTLGIIGGMGSLATADLFRKIVENTKADKDQEHLRVLVDNNPQIPDRTAAILYGGENPLPYLEKSAKGLIAQGAEALLLPCNTAHYFRPALQERVGVPVLDMLRLTAAALKERGVTLAGILATAGTVQSGLYQEVMAEAGISLVLPEPFEQEAMMSLIYDGVKAGRADYDSSAVVAAAERMLSAGAETVILGCTELPVAKDLYHWTFPHTDPTLELARGAILYAGGILK